MASSITTISLSPKLRKRLDREAARQRRSRSFIVAEAIEQYLEGREQDGFSKGRERTLREGLALSPAERVRVAEELWWDFARGRKPPKPWTAAFDTWDEYQDWRRRRPAEP
ncbi:MAG TPA: ribbon-helix-helix protein, CopG family [Gemmatimonadales bacterium]|jgi:predicted transcriptional regulator